MIEFSQLRAIRVQERCQLLFKDELTKNKKERTAATERVDAQLRGQLCLSTTTRRGVERFGSDAQYTGSIIGVMVADQSIDGLFYHDRIWRLDSSNRQLHNNEGESSDDDFFSLDTDETLSKLPDKTAGDHWDTYTYGWQQDGKRQYCASKFQMAATICTNEAQRHAAWRVLDAPKGHGATQFVPDTSVNQHAPDGPAGGLLWKVCVQRSIFAIPQRQLASFVQASSKFAGTSFGNLTLWHRGVDLTIAFKMPEGAKSNALTKPVTGAKMK